MGADCIPSRSGVCTAAAGAPAAPTPTLAPSGVRCAHVGLPPTHIAATLAANIARAWTCTNLPAEAVMDVGDTNKVILTQQTLTQGRLLNVTTREPYFPRYILARAGQGGPVLAAQKLEPFAMRAAMDGYFWVAQENTGENPSLNLECTVAVHLCSRKFPRKLPKKNSMFLCTEQAPFVTSTAYARR